MSEVGRQFGRLVSAIIVTETHLAQTVTHLLSDEPLDDATRNDLKRSIALSMAALIRELDTFKPGEGDKLLEAVMDLGRRG